MPDEVFRKTAGISNADLRLIDQVWADALRRNRWQRRGWRLVNRVRALPIVRILLRHSW